MSLTCFFAFFSAFFSSFFCAFRNRFRSPSESCGGGGSILLVDGGPAGVIGLTFLQSDHTLGFVSHPFQCSYYVSSQPLPETNCIDMYQSEPT